MHGSGTLPDEAVDRRITVVLSMAAQFRTEIALSDLPSLLPANGPSDPGAVAEWIKTHPATAQLDGDLVVGPDQRAHSPGDIAARRARGLDFYAAARDLFAGRLAPLTPWLRCACVTGSTAYREPAEEDDVDLMLVTATGTLWFTLLRVFLALRRERRSHRPSRPWCVNYVLDEREAFRSYRGARGFLFAREALTARPIMGAAYYSELIRSSPWMAEELPRMFARWTSAAGDPEPRFRAGLALRIANAVAFPLLATYLQLVGQWRNHRLRTSGRADAMFRTRTTFQEYALHTSKFDHLKRMTTVPSPSGLGEAST